MKVLFFSPFQAIWQHAFPEALIARALIEQGHSVDIMQCSELYKNGCIAMGAYGKGFDSKKKEKEEVCYFCKNQKKILNNFHGAKKHALNDFINEDEMTFIENELPKVEKDKYLDFYFQDVPAGRIAAYLTLIKYKKKSTTLETKEFEYYLNDLKNVMITILSIKKYIATNRPSHIIAFNSFYGENHAIYLVARQQGIPFFWLHTGPNLSNRLKKVQFGLGHHYDILNKNFHYWNEKHKNEPTSQAGIESVKAHYNELLCGKNIFVYSQSDSNHGEDLLKRYHISSEKKVILAAMSSNDERIAAETIGVLSPLKDLPFVSQFEWITQLILFTKKNTKYHLIIRLHPRDFPNRRDNQISEQSRQYNELFNHLPNNVTINWPDDKISVYHIAKFTHLCLHSGSSVGKEMALLGIPVLNYLPHSLAYPPNMSPSAYTQDLYFSSIHQLIEKGWSLDYAISAMRWCAIELHEALLDLSSQSNLTEQVHSNLLVRIIKKVLRSISPFYEKKNNCRYAKSRDLSNKHEFETILEKQYTSKLEFIPIKKIDDGDGEKNEIIHFLNTILLKIYRPEESYPFETLKDRITTHCRKIN